MNRATQANQNVRQKEEINVKNEHATVGRPDPICLCFYHGFFSYNPCPCNHLRWGLRLLDLPLVLRNTSTILSL
uniref:Uncharacterized protein n=1 Tax=Nelumbo nucifera TaxID=4432 RepID=A0A822Z3P5_NELNU|nr:TPA_asm: hypothetical protein HUJ06_013985 [Nelumbo nucifera]